jgi:predicted porin
MVKLQQQGYYLENDRYRNFTGELLQYQYAFSETSALSAYVQNSQLDYRKKRPDADRYTAGLGYSTAISGRAVVYSGLYGGSENAKGNVPHLDQDFYGIRVGGSLGVSPMVRLNSSLSAEQREFGGPQPLVMIEPQKDTQIDFSLGATVQFSPTLSLQPNYTYTKNSSNNPLSDYDRHTASVDLRYEF